MQLSGTPGPSGLGLRIAPAKVLNPMRVTSNGGNSMPEGELKRGPWGRVSRANAFLHHIHGNLKSAKVQEKIGKEKAAQFRFERASMHDESQNYSGAPRRCR
jgi:hypothetical protein